MEAARRLYEGVPGGRGPGGGQQEGEEAKQASHTPGDPKGSADSIRLDFFLYFLIFCGNTRFTSFPRHSTSLYIHFISPYPRTSFECVHPARTVDFRGPGGGQQEGEEQTKIPHAW